jgi:predicted nucleotidyltransferase
MNDELRPEYDMKSLLKDGERGKYTKKHGKMTAIKVPTVDKRKRIPQKAIDEVIRQIAEQFRPQQIILFGSYARGNPRPESDVDLLVVMDTPLKESQQSLEIRRHLGVMFGLDLIVYTPKHLQERVEMKDWFLRDVLEEGKVVYESRNG